MNTVLLSYVLQASGTVYRLREGEEVLLKVSDLYQVHSIYSNVVACFYYEILPGVFTPGGSVGQRENAAHML